MPIPFRRQSKTRSAKRRTHQGTTKPTITTCSNCGVQITPHNVCKKCGYYKGKQILAIDED